MSALRAFLSGLIDDAGLFPPARLPMREALAAHARSEASEDAWILGRFIVPASRLADMAGLLAGVARPVRAAVVLDGGDLRADLARLAAWEPERGHVAVEAIECPPGDASSARIAELFAACEATGAFAQTTVYAEISLAGTEPVDRALAAVRAARERGLPACAKVRCGGVVADAMPPGSRLAEFIWHARALGVPFKATAGLHHPVRHFNAAAGFAMHGFLNVIGAGELAHACGADRTALEAILAEEDPARFRLDANAFAWGSLAADASAVRAARSEFVHSYGSCSFEEPLADLRDLGILPAAALRA